MTDYEPLNPLAQLATSKVEVPYATLQKMQEIIQQQTVEIGQLRAEIERAQRGAEGSATHALGEAFDRAFLITRFAVANLPPEQNPSWPHVELRWLAEHIETLPGKKGAQDLAITLTEFARRARKYAEAFADGRLKELVQEENLARNSGSVLSGFAVPHQGMHGQPPEGDGIDTVEAVGTAAEQQP